MSEAETETEISPEDKMFEAAMGIVRQRQLDSAQALQQAVESQRPVINFPKADLDDDLAEAFNAAERSPHAQLLAVLFQLKKLGL